MMSTSVSQVTSTSFEIKKLMHLMLPILITQFAQAGFGLIDTIMAGQLSAVDLAPLLWGWFMDSNHVAV